MKLEYLVTSSILICGHISRNVAHTGNVHTIIYLGIEI